MAHLVIVINTEESIAELNSKLKDKSDGSNGVIALEQYLQRGIAGMTDMSCQVTTRDTDPAVATSGSGSAQFTYSVN